MWVNLALILAFVAGCIFGIAFAGLIINEEFKAIHSEIDKLKVSLLDYSVEASRGSELYKLLSDEIDSAVRLEDAHWSWTRRWVNHLLSENNLSEFEFKAVPDDLNAPTYVRPFECGVEDDRCE